MEKEAFSDREVIAYSNKTFINVELDADKDRAIFRRYNPPGLPATYVLGADGKIVGTAIGLMSPAEYLAWLEQSAEASKKIAEVRSKPADPESDARLAELYMSVGSYAQAIKASEDGLKDAKTPETKGRLVCRRAEASSRLDPDYDVSPSAQEMLALDPDGKFGLRDDAMLLLAEYESRHEKPKEALARVEQAIKDFPASDRMDGLLYYRARLTWLVTGKTDRSIAWLEEWLKQFPQSTYRAWAQADLRELKSSR